MAYVPVNPPSFDYNLELATHLVSSLVAGSLLYHYIGQLDCVNQPLHTLAAVQTFLGACMPITSLLLLFAVTVSRHFPDRVSYNLSHSVTSNLVPSQLAGQVVDLLSSTLLDWSILQLPCH